MPSPTLAHFDTQIFFEWMNFSKSSLLILYVNLYFNFLNMFNQLLRSDDLKDRQTSKAVCVYMCVPMQK